MQKVTTVNLNGRAYQLEEGAYDQLQAYLESASRQLEGNPDRAEILADFEQAIGDKCDRLVSAYKAVVTTADMTRVLAEMGPVVTEETPRGGTADASEQPNPSASDGRRLGRRLYRLPEGKQIAGVCTGLAAYFGIDVAVIRIAFILPIIFWFPWAVLFYIVPMLAIPEARTPEEVAAAHGNPFNARDVMEQARSAGRNLHDQARRGSAAWRRQWRREERRWRAAQRARTIPPWMPPPGPGWAIAGPFMGLVGLAWISLVAAAAVSIFRTHTVFGWALPAGMPIWVALVGLLLIAQVVVGPLHHASYGWRSPSPLFALWDALVPLAVFAFVVWLLYQHMTPPDNVGEFLRQVPDAFRQIAREFAAWLNGVAGAPN